MASILLRILVCCYTFVMTRVPTNYIHSNIQECILLFITITITQIISLPRIWNFTSKSPLSRITLFDLHIDRRRLLIQTYFQFCGRPKKYIIHLILTRFRYFSSHFVQFIVYTLVHIVGLHFYKTLNTISMLRRSSASSHFT